MESDVVIDRVTELLDGHPDLIAGFNRFIPQDTNKPKNEPPSPPSPLMRPTQSPVGPVQAMINGPPSVARMTGMHGMMHPMQQRGMVPPGMQQVNTSQGMVQMSTGGMPGHGHGHGGQEQNT